MRILYHHKIASRDGQATHIEEMIAALRALGHEVAICAPDVYGRDSGGGGSASWVGTLKSTLPKAVYEMAEVAYSTVTYARVRSAVHRFRPDVIYERYGLFNVGGVLAAQHADVPLLLEVNAPYAVARRKYGGLKLGHVADACERFVWQHATFVLPVTQVMADLIAQAGVPRERMTVIPNAIDPSHYANLPDVVTAKRALGISGRTVIGFVGFVREWDRLERVIDWLAPRAAARGLHLLVVGDGPARAQLEAQARRLGVADHVSFTGVVARPELPRHAAAFDIALQTALVPYASPLCLFEYLALGKAIVAPDQPNHREILRAGVDALLYEPDGPGDLERAIETLVGDEALRSRLEAGARETMAARQFTWRRNAERVVEVAARL